MAFSFFPFVLLVFFVFFPFAALTFCFSVYKYTKGRQVAVFEVRQLQLSQHSVKITANQLPVCKIRVIKAGPKDF